MAINVYGSTAGKPNGVTALADATFADAGITVLNTAIIYEVSPSLGSYVSYVPERTINAITEFVNGKSYIIQALSDMDLTDYVGPPFPEGGGTGGEYWIEGNIDS